MIAKVFIDSDILVYAYDHSEPKKQGIAIKEIGQVVEENSGVISNQVLSEFFQVTTRKIAEPLSKREAEQRVIHFCQIWPVLPVNEIVVLEAIRGVRSYQISYWDALIWATARMNQVGKIFSENFSNDAFIEGIRFRNPFL